MAPPTRHSSRLGATSLSAIPKEDENAGSLLTSRQPIGKAPRGRKELAALAVTGAGKAIGANTKAAGVSTTGNARKRILDDRTNNVKTLSTISTSTNLKPTGTKPPQTRKPSNTVASKKPPMVLDELKTMEAAPKRTIKPIKKEAAGRSTLLRKGSSTNVMNQDLGEYAGSSSKATSNATSRAAGTTGPSRTRRVGPQRNTGRAGKPIGNGEVEDAYDVGHVTKKIRTSEPDEIQKENRASGAAHSSDVNGFKKEATRAHTKPLGPHALKTAKSSFIDQKVIEQDWDDLDEGDEEDPLMVREYVTEIYHYMRELELETLPDSDYMLRQNELTWKMRGVLVDWIIEVHSKFRLLPETLYLAINLMDRFLTKRSVALIKFQLVGVTALFVAAKYEEVICPSVTNFLYMTDGGYDCDEILKAETYMLEMLDWDLRYPNPLNFLRRVSKADNYDIQSRTFAKYFMEISIVDYRLVAAPPSLLAATSIWLARKLLGRGVWNANLIHYSGYEQSEILPIAQLMLDYVLRSGCKNLGMGLDPKFIGQAGYEGGNEHGNLFKKYATRKFFRVSEIVRDWAVDRYTFETPTGYEWDKLEEWASSSLKGGLTGSKRIITSASSRLHQRVRSTAQQEDFDQDDEVEQEHEEEVHEEEDVELDDAEQDEYMEHQYDEEEQEGY